MVIDRNREHPTRPILRCGGALKAVTRRHREGAPDLRAIIFGIRGREGRGQAGRGDGGPGISVRQPVTRSAPPSRRQARRLGPKESPITRPVGVAQPGAAVLGLAMEHMAAHAARGGASEPVTAQAVTEAARRHDAGDGRPRDRARAVERRLQRCEHLGRRQAPHPAAPTVVPAPRFPRRRWPSRQVPSPGWITDRPCGRSQQPFPRPKRIRRGSSAPSMGWSQRVSRVIGMGAA